MNRRQYLELMTMLGITTALPSFLTMNDPINTRTIPSTGEKIPCVGVGTWQTFNVGTSEAERTPLKEVLKTLISKGGKVIDSSRCTDGPKLLSVTSPRNSALTTNYSLPRRYGQAAGKAASVR